MIAAAREPICAACGAGPLEEWRKADGKPYCFGCHRKLPKPVHANGNGTPQVTVDYIKKNSKQVREQMMESKRIKMLEKGELCPKCGKGCPDPGHEFCFGCERHDAKRVAVKPLGKMPESCMYGWLGRFARKLDSPLSAAYPAVLAIAAGYGVPNFKTLRSNLYVTVIGEKGTGKTRVMDRAQQAWNPPSEAQVVKKYPGSEIGLIQLLGGKKAKEMDESDFIPKPYLLTQDEMRMTFNKMDIKGSSLPNMLNDMFYHDDFGTAAKQGHWACCARLSVVGGLTCDGPDEFAEVYGAATAQGTYDRTIFGLFPTDWEFDDMWEPPVDENVNFRRPKGCSVPREAYETVKEWRRKDFENRRRLGELALRIALVTASLNHDDEVGQECLRCALEFIEWQEEVRRVYCPSETDDLDAQAERAIVRALEKHTDWIEWRDLCLKHGLYKRAKGSVRLNRVRRAMTFEGVIEEEYELKNDGSRGEKSGRVRLA